MRDRGTVPNQDGGNAVTATNDSDVNDVRLRNEVGVAFGCYVFGDHMVPP